MRWLRTFLIWITMLAVPLQSFAAASMLACPDQARSESLSAAAPVGHSHLAETPVGGDDVSHGKRLGHDGHPCGMCGACHCVAAIDMGVMMAMSGVAHNRIDTRSAAMASEALAVDERPPRH